MDTATTKQLWKINNLAIQVQAIEKMLRIPLNQQFWTAMPDFPVNKASASAFICAGITYLETLEETLEDQAWEEHKEDLESADVIPF